MKIKIVVDIISFLILVVLAFIANWNGNDIWIPIISALLVILPTFYSVIPLVKERMLEIHKSKNRLSHYTFTDREQDVYEIIKKLSTPEHIMQIRGTAKNCGKTWLAKKICDCINYPKELNSDNMQRINCPYRNATYIDMKGKNESFLDEYFENHIVTPKNVLIFDHVTNLDAILSKQEIFHFQLIYILNEDDIIIPFSHVVTEFPKDNISELHQKIQRNHPAINSISKDEINVLYNLTGGNIGKISALLSHEEHIIWLKEISHRKFTDYEKELNIINANLYSGNYEEAERKLELFKSEYCKSFSTNNDLFFKYCFTKSDCEHLLNKYTEALDTLSVISTEQFAFENEDCKLELRRAHYYKHLWQCNDALETLQGIKDKSLVAITDSFGILLAKYFINDLTVPNTIKDSLTEFMDYFTIVENSSLKLDDSVIHKINRYKVYHTFYKEKPADEAKLIELVNHVIELYKAQNNRLLANAYFLRGEIYRLYKKYNLAENDYEQSILVTNDDNIRIQVGVIRYYLFVIKKISYPPKFEVLSKEAIIRLCKDKNRYGEKLFHRINCIEQGDINASDIISCFENRIMPIL